MIAAKLLIFKTWGLASKVDFTNTWVLLAQIAGPSSKL